jgi:t-SNARE complex subunit (syntaxin)
MSDPNTEGEADWKARRGRNIALAVGLVLFVIIVFVVTIVKLSANVAPHTP